MPTLRSIVRDVVAVMVTAALAILVERYISVHLAWLIVVGGCLVLAWLHELHKQIQEILSGESAKPIVRTGMAIILGASIGAGCLGLAWLCANSKARPVSQNEIAPPLVSPQRPGIKVELDTPLPSNQLCTGLSEQNEIQCLCPRPLEFSMKYLPAPNDNNYATEVIITAGKEPMYRVRLFARSQIHPGGELWASPYGKDKAALFLGVMGYDLYSIIVRSSAPEQEFKLELHSAEGLRIKCINQQN